MSSISNFGVSTTKKNTFEILPRLRSLFAAILIICSATMVGSANDGQPNIILINLDDADVDLFEPQFLATHFPNINQLANEGIRFTNCHVTTPLCGPSRACLLRGQYAHACGIKVNDTFADQSNGFRGGVSEYISRGYAENDLPVWMQGAGYHTALVGKYLNNGAITSVPVGWDEFYASLGSNYYSTAQFTTRSDPNGIMSVRSPAEYRTNVETVDCLQLINKHVFSESTKPFFFYVAPFAPHLQAKGSGEMYDVQYKNWWKNARIPKHPDFNEADVEDKPVHKRQLPLLSPAAVQRADKEYRDRLLSMISIDRMVAQIRHRLEALDLADNTYIILTSDNGYQLGHHRTTGKLDSYNRCTNVPLIVWGPDVQPNSGVNHLLANIDLAPTLVDLAGGQFPGFVQGMSFKQLIDDPNSVPATDWRYGILIENWQDGYSGELRIDYSYTALRTLDEVYTEHSNGGREFYDLTTDPYQLDNKADLLTPAERAFFKTVMQQIKLNPTKAITSVPDDLLAKATKGDLHVRGIAEHQFGVDHIRLAIRNLETGQYWDGQNWQTGFFANQVAAQLTEGQLTDWSYAMQKSNIPNGYGRLVVAARPVDTDGNVGFPYVYRVTMDSIDPETQIRTPTAGSIVPHPTNLTGFAFDQSQIAVVKLIIKNLDTGNYFDGTTWVEDRAVIDVVPQSKTFWRLTINPPIGRYWFSARAYDEAGNYDRTPATGIFRIQ